MAPEPRSSGRVEAATEEDDVLMQFALAEDSLDGALTAIARLESRQKLEEELAAVARLETLRGTKKEVQEVEEVLAVREVREQLEPRRGGLLSGMVSAGGLAFIAFRLLFRMLCKLAAQLAPKSSQLQEGPIAPDRQPEATMEFECPICTQGVADEAFVWGACDEGHRFCLECMYMHIRTQILDQGRKPSCPGCMFQLQEPDIESVVGCRVDSERILAVVRHIDLASLGCIRCPSCHEAWLEPPAEADRAAECVCGHCFCARCFQPYHFQSTCAEAVQILERYALWQHEGREAYLRAAAQHQAAAAEQLREFETARASHEERAGEVQARLEEFHAMERWKAENCRTCPHCGRVVQKLSGCDVMRCGRDVDGGGNVQNGCGERFGWNSAPRYEPREPELRPLLEEFALQRSAQAGPPMLHEVEPGVPLLCDGCQQPLAGARFRCIHCRSFECCTRCEMDISLGRVARHPERSHSFQIRLPGFGS